MVINGLQAEVIDGLNIQDASSHLLLKKVIKAANDLSANNISNIDMSDDLPANDLDKPGKIDKGRIFDAIKGKNLLDELKVRETKDTLIDIIRDKKAPVEETGGGRAPVEPEEGGIKKGVKKGIIDLIKEKIGIGRDVDTGEKEAGVAGNAIPIPLPVPGDKDGVKKPGLNINPLPDKGKLELPGNMGGERIAPLPDAGIKLAPVAGIMGNVAGKAAPMAQAIPADTMTTNKEAVKQIAPAVAATTTKAAVTQAAPAVATTTKAAVTQTAPIAATTTTKATVAQAAPVQATVAKVVPAVNTGGTAAVVNKGALAGVRGGVKGLV